MTARERVLMIRLMENLKRYPAYAMLLGIEATDLEDNQNRKKDPLGLRSNGGPLCFLEGRRRASGAERRQRYGNDSICVFCGQKPGTFRSTTIQCGPTWQPACKACEKELKGLDEAELCRRALVRGMAEKPDRLRERIALITEAENHRPKCLRCGANLSFMKVQELDNSPMQDSIFKEPFEVLPACCESCGKYEFFNPVIIRKNKYLAYLIWKDT